MYVNSNKYIPENKTLSPKNLKFLWSGDLRHL